MLSTRTRTEVEADARLAITRAVNILADAGWVEEACDLDNDMLGCRCTVDWLCLRDEAEELVAQATDPA
jgi:hypothetical protein